MFVEGMHRITLYQFPLDKVLAYCFTADKYMEVKLLFFIPYGLCCPEKFYIYMKNNLCYQFKEIQLCLLCLSYLITGLSCNISYARHEASTSRTSISS